MEQVPARARNRGVPLPPELREILEGGLAETSGDPRATRSRVPTPASNDRLREEVRREEVAEDRPVGFSPS